MFCKETKIDERLGKVGNAAT